MSDRRQPRDRYTNEQRQEDRSINQFRDRMHEFGWLPERPERDVGEDLIVRILTNSQPVGVPFYAQLKSITDLADRRKGDFLTYRLEVDDLLRWESSSVPVVIFVWDVVLHEGRWDTVKSLVQRLENRRTEWRKQKTVTAYLPWSNTTNDRGLRSLHAEIGYQLYALIAGNRNVEVNFTVAIPRADDAASDYGQLEGFVREGTPVTIDGQYLKEVVFSDWWAEWFVDPEAAIRVIGNISGAFT